MPIKIIFGKCSDQNVPDKMGTQERERLTLWGPGAGVRSRQASQKR